MESNFHAPSRWFFCYYFCLKPCYLCSLFYYTSLFPWQQDRMRRWVATGSWEDGNAMESSTWNNNMQITLAYDKQQRKWYFFGGKTAYLVFGMCSFFWQLLFLVIFLAFLFFFFFWDQNKIIKGQKKFNLTLHVTQCRCSGLCFQRQLLSRALKKTFNWEVNLTLDWATFRCQDVAVQFSHSVVSDSLWPHRLQHTRLPCPSPTPRAYTKSCPLHQWCHPTISSSVIPFSSCLQSFPASGSFQT